jgi:ferredoxin
MAVMITDLCINCDACVEVCPVGAIASEGDSPSY